MKAVWDDENNCWCFSATDVVRAINDEPDYTKAGNYWRWLKRKLKLRNVLAKKQSSTKRTEEPTASKEEQAIGLLKGMTSEQIMAIISAINK